MPDPFLTSSLLPVPHGFSTRDGGVSEGPYRSLNLGAAVGDQPERVAENRARVERFAEVLPGALQLIHQVHGDRVVEAPVSALTEADAIWSADPHLAVAVSTADCVPVLLVDPVGKRVAAVHSGWKGTYSKISARA